MKKGFWGCEACGAAFKPHPNLDFDGIGNRLVPARDFFLEKKQKRARCSGLPSRFILCRTCRAQAACLGGVSVCIPYAAGAACSSSTVRQIGTRLWPCTSAQGAAPRCAVMRCGRQMRWFEGVWWRFAPSGGRAWRGVLRRWFRWARWWDASEKPCTARLSFLFVRQAISNVILGYGWRSAAG